MAIEKCFYGTHQDNPPVFVMMMRVITDTRNFMCGEFVPPRHAYCAVFLSRIVCAFIRRQFVPRMRQFLAESSKTIFLLSSYNRVSVGVVFGDWSKMLCTAYSLLKQQLLDKKPLNFGLRGFTGWFTGLATCVARSFFKIRIDKSSYFISHFGLLSFSMP